MRGRSVTAKTFVKAKINVEVKIIRMPVETNNYEKSLISCTFDLFFIYTEMHTFFSTTCTTNYADHFARLSKFE